MALVHAYKQSDDPRTKDGDLIEVTSGWCIGMATHWLIHKKANTDFWKKANTSEGETAFRMVMALQQIWYKQGGWNQKKEFDVVDKIFSGKKLKRVHYSDTPLKKAASAEDVWLGVTNSTGTYALISLGFSATSGHAIAVVKNADDSFSVFDPNCGEYKYKDASEFRKGLKTEIFEKMNYKSAVSRFIISKYE